MAKKTLEEKIRDSRMADWRARHGIGYDEGHTPRADRLAIAKLEDSYADALRAAETGTYQESREARNALREEAARITQQLVAEEAGQFSAERQSDIKRLQDANKTIAAYRPSAAVDKQLNTFRTAEASFVPQDVGPEMAELLNKYLGELPKGEDQVAFFGAFADELNVSAPALLEKLTDTHERSALKLREHLAVKGPERAYLDALDQSWSITNEMEKGKGRIWGERFTSLYPKILNSLSSASRGERSASVEEIVEETVPERSRRELETRKRLLDEQSPTAMMREVLNDPEFDKLRREYGYTSPIRFYEAYVERKGKLQRFAPIPREGAVMIDGAETGGSPEQIEQVEDGIRDLETAGDIAFDEEELAEFGRAHAKGVTQAERDWLERFEHVDEPDFSVYEDPADREVKRIEFQMETLKEAQEALEDGHAMMSPDFLEEYRDLIADALRKEQEAMDDALARASMSPLAGDIMHAQDAAARRAAVREMMGLSEVAEEVGVAADPGSGLDPGAQPTLAELQSLAAEKEAELRAAKKEAQGVEVPPPIPSPGLPAGPATVEYPTDGASVRPQTTLDLQAARLAEERRAQLERVGELNALRKLHEAAERGGGLVYEDPVTGEGLVRPGPRARPGPRTPWGKVQREAEQ